MIEYIVKCNLKLIWFGFQGEESPMIRPVSRPDSRPASRPEGCVPLKFICESVILLSNWSFSSLPMKNMTKKTPHFFHVYLPSCLHCFDPSLPSDLCSLLHLIILLTVGVWRRTLQGCMDIAVFYSRHSIPIQYYNVLCSFLIVIVVHYIWLS